MIDNQKSNEKSPSNATIEITIGKKDDLIKVLKIPTEYKEQTGILRNAMLINYVFRMYAKYNEPFRKQIIDILTINIERLKWRPYIEGFDNIIEKKLKDIRTLPNIGGEEYNNNHEEIEVKKIIEDTKEHFLNLLSKTPNNTIILKHLLDSLENERALSALYLERNKKKGNAEIFEKITTLSKWEVKMSIEYIENNNPTKNELNQLNEFQETYKDFLNG